MNPSDAVFLCLAWMMTGVRPLRSLSCQKYERNILLLWKNRGYARLTDTPAAVSPGLPLQEDKVRY